MVHISMILETQFRKIMQDKHSTLTKGFHSSIISFIYHICGILTFIRQCIKTGGSAA